VNEPLLPIGHFARLCRLSVKQLRNYDELGLLRPTWVDPASGYRYHRADQARDALSIGLLRSLDVPLTTIGRVLSGADVAETLGAVRDRLEADLLRRRRVLATLTPRAPRGRAFRPGSAAELEGGAGLTEELLGVPRGRRSTAR
jgi:DNA-binding transcriptional MerR regulator